MQLTAKEYLDKLKTDYLAKQYLCIIGEILLTIRGDWASDIKSRTKCCLTLIDMYRKNCLLNKTDEFIDTLEYTIKHFTKDMDGRYFRDNFPDGYIGITYEDFGELE